MSASTLPRNVTCVDPTRAAQHTCALLQRHRFRTSNEATLQEAIAQVLRSGLLAFEREVELSDADRIDFIVERSVGLEVKIHGALTEVTRQLHRYAAHDRIRALVLVTTRARHNHVPATLGGKPIHVVHLLGSAL